MRTCKGNLFALLPSELSGKVSPHEKNKREVSKHLHYFQVFNGGKMVIWAAFVYDCHGQLS